ncbi:hypothetical protein CHU98_g8459 [Xylaria longipes]|nr:hypothetical protein CHU98_g8459 [Xylaria longipes]
MASNQHPLHGVARNEKLWPANKHSLKVCFLNGHDGERKLVRRVVREHYRDVPMRIKFVFLLEGAPGPSDIRVKFSKESASFVGRDAEAHPGEATLWLNLHDNIENYRQRKLQRQADILHEFGHALGMEHEHGHRDCMLTWNYKTLQAITGWDAKKVHLAYDKIDSARLTTYDPKSIMHYSVSEGETLEGGIKIPLNTKLSDGDKKLLAALYPKPPTDPVRTGKRKYDEELEKDHRKMRKLEEKSNRYYDHEPYRVTMWQSTMLIGVISLLLVDQVVSLKV